MELYLKYRSYFLFICQVYMIPLIYSIFTIIFFVGHFKSSRFDKTSLAFQTSEISQVQLEKLKHQEIIVNGLDNRMQRNKIINLLKTEISPSYRLINNAQKLTTWASKLQELGIFKSICIKRYINNQKEIISCNLLMNPIIKKITVINLSNKIVPLSYLKLIFRSQLGQPMNFVNINRTSSLIKKWYRNNGYIDVNVKINYNKSNSNVIEIDIKESLIQKFHLIISSHSKSSKQTAFYYSLKDILQIKIGKPLNIYQLDYNLKQLNHKNLIQKGYYKVGKDSNELFVYITPLHDRSISLFSRKYVITQQFKELLESYWHYGSLMFTLNQNIRSFNHNTIGSLYSLLINRRQIYSSPIDKISQADFVLYPSLNRYLISNSYYTSWYLPDSVFSPNTNFGLKYCFHYPQQYHTNFVFKTSCPSLGRFIDIKYEISLVKICKLFFTSISSTFNKTVDIYKKYNQYISNKKIYIYPKCSITKHSNFSINIHHYLLNNIEFQKFFEVKQSTLKSILFYNHTCFYKLKNNSFKNYSYFCRKYIESSCNLTQYIFGVKLPLYLENNQYISKKLSELNLYNLEISHLIPSNTFNTIQNLHYSKIKHILRKTCYIKRHTVRVYIQIIGLTSPEEFFPSSDNTIVIDSNLIHSYIKSLFYFPVYSRNCKIDYYLYNYKNNIIYFFMDYFQSHTNTSGSQNHPNYSSKYHTYNNLCLKLSYGVGLQISTPVKQIPALKLEYGYDINNNYSLHLSLVNYN
uniref:POTRA domain-containing protein n=1 Tax=Trichogloeopsis pedicellata TaxID=1495610 RepID=A0A1G4P0H5_9FLOR|nr:Hypothetical protein ORF_4 [Trichogloeopsis pedicellata]SCW24392.1 Hypothetical protein ORF_4 [Trichogloeopsis pedicellata]